MINAVKLIASTTFSAFVLIFLYIYFFIFLRWRNGVALP